MTPRKKSRADHDLFDLNDTVHQIAARGVKAEELAVLFETLDRADELFTRDNGKGFLAALHAVGVFLATHSPGWTGRFSRPFELAYAELRNRPSNARRIFAPTGSGSGGVNGRISDQFIKAASAWTCDRLHKQCGIRAVVASNSVALALEAAGFKFGSRRLSKGAAVLAWRRDYPRGAGAAAERYRNYQNKPPVQFSDDAATDAARLHTWFKQLLARAGYGDVA